MQEGRQNVPKHTMKLIAALLLAAGLLTIVGCRTTGSSVTDAGCTIWREYGFQPSRLDTPATQAGLIRLGRGMGAACDER